MKRKFKKLVCGHYLLFMLGVSAALIGIGLEHINPYEPRHLFGTDLIVMGIFVLVFSILVSLVLDMFKKDKDK